MIGILPTSVEISNKSYSIRTDYRVALLVFEAMADVDLSDAEKAVVAVECLYTDYESIPQCDIVEAIKKAYWFLDGGDMPKSKKQPVKLMDWKQDESIIFPALNKAAGFETRTVEYMHWWSFLGLFNEIGEGLYSQVMNIRSKRAKGKKLEKWEREFYNEHREMIDLKQKLSSEEEAEIGRAHV